MKKTLWFCLLFLTGCVPSSSFNVHEGCRVPKVFDTFSLQFASTPPIFAGVRGKQYVYVLLSSKKNPDGSVPVIITNMSPKQHNYMLDPSTASEDSGLQKYVHPVTKAVWLWGADEEGFKSAHDCM
ncbi:hypothetical protein [Deinococcus misasensis]|uniref:hypothetical protein n=1 Tax=Deinococcus misasensis TaxID=392413 RepID=UPI00054E3765|nr:hypothetical protein [Deinococcus misasensis]